MTVHTDEEVLEGIKADIQLIREVSRSLPATAVEAKEAIARVVNRVETKALEGLSAYKPPGLESGAYSLRKQMAKWTAVKGDHHIWFGRLMYGHPTANVGGKSMAVWKAIHVYMHKQPWTGHEKMTKLCGEKKCVNPDHMKIEVV